MILLSTGTLRYYELNRVFYIAAELGFDGIELIVDDRWDTCDPVYLKRLIDRYNLPIPSIHSPFGFIETPAWGSEPAVRMEKSIALAEELGAEAVIIHLPFFMESRYARWVYEEIPGLQEGTRVRLAVENMPHAYKILGRLGVILGTGSIYGVDSRKGFNRFLVHISKICFPRSDWETLLGFRYLVLDTTHLATGGIDPVEAYEKMKSRLALIHLSNFDGREHQPLGRGRMDMKRFLRHISADGYTGPLVLEYMPEYFPDRTEATARKILADDLAIVRSIISASRRNE